MIAAAGRVDPRALRVALIQMASNENPAHTHERRSLGAGFRHEHGWGVAWVSAGELHFTRSPRSCLTDPRVSRIDELDSQLLFLHARRASRPTSVREANSHPFIEERDGRFYAFCHNGTVEDLRPLRPADGWKPIGGTDSELLSHYFVQNLDPGDPEHSILRSVKAFHEYNSLHSFLACESWILAIAQRNPFKSQKHYHALWEGRGPDLRVVSSEPVEGIGCESWERMKEPSVLRLSLPVV